MKKIKAVTPVFNAIQTAMDIHLSAGSVSEKAVELKKYLDSLTGLKSVGSWFTANLSEFNFTREKVHTDKKTGKVKVYTVQENKALVSYRNALGYLTSKSASEKDDTVKDFTARKQEKADKANAKVQAIRDELIQKEGLSKSIPLADAVKTMTMSDLNHALQIITNEIKSRELPKDKAGHVRMVKPSATR